MPITDIDIFQSNYTGDSNLLAVHNPIVFLVNATYTGEAPTVLYVDVEDSEAEVLGTFRCIPRYDISGTVRQFMFVADSILRGYMDTFDDFVQSSGSIDYCSGMTKEFTLRFYVAMEAETTLDIVVIHAARQFSEDQNAEDIYENEALSYVGYENKPLYVYFYNSDEANTITIDDGGFGYDIILDYDDVEFSDSDDVLFEMFIGT